MSGETEFKTDAQKRKGRVYRTIIYGLSWSPEIRESVPAALWAHPDIADGYRSGPLIKSMKGIVDPDNKKITWTAWLFARNVVMIQSSAMPKTAFINLRDISAEAVANPGDTPTAGL